MVEFDNKDNLDIVQLSHLLANHENLHYDHKLDVALGLLKLHKNQAVKLRNCGRARENCMKL